MKAHQPAEGRHHRTKSVRMPAKEDGAACVERTFSSGRQYFDTVVDHRRCQNATRPGGKTMEINIVLRRFELDTITKQPSDDGTLH